VKLIQRVSKLLRRSGLAAITLASGNNIYLVDAIVFSKSIQHELSVLLSSVGYLIIHDAVYGYNNDSTIRFSELKFKVRDHRQRKITVCCAILWWNVLLNTTDCHSLFKTLLFPNVNCY
jgi:hypothetical protein